MSDIEDIKGRVNLVDVVGDYVRLLRAGAGSWKGLCPFHKEKSPSFTVSEDRQLWHCFGCGKGGDMFSFVMEQEGVDFREALTLLAERAGVTLTPRSVQGGHAADAGNDADRRRRVYEVLELATRFYQKQLTDGEGPKAALPYLRGRGITDESIERFRLGYAPAGWRYLTAFLTGQGCAMHDIVAAGLAIQKQAGDDSQSQRTNNRQLTTDNCYDRFRDRVMFPIADPMGRVIGFSGRVLPGADDKNAKYINTSESPVYHKSSVLYGIAQAKTAMKDAGRAVVVEGNMDVVAAQQAGIGETVAVSGTALTPDHARIIRRYAPSVVLFFDNDAAGQTAAIRSAAVCVAAGLAVRLVAGGDGKDAAEIAQHDSAALRTLVDAAGDAVHVLLARLSVGRDMAQIAQRQAVAHTVALIVAAYPERAEREHWTGVLAQATQMSLGAATEMVAQAAAARSDDDTMHVGIASRDADAPVSTPAGPVEAAVRTLVMLAAHSDRALAALGQAAINDRILAAQPALATVVQLARSGATSWAAVVDGTGDDALRAAYERVMRLPLPSAVPDRDPAEDVPAVVARLHAAWTATQRARLTADLAAAEGTGDRDRAAALLAEISALNRTVATSN